MSLFEDNTCKFQKKFFMDKSINLFFEQIFSPANWWNNYFSSTSGSSHKHLVYSYLIEIVISVPISQSDSNTRLLEVYRNFFSFSRSYDFLCLIKLIFTTWKYNADSSIGLQIGLSIEFTPFSDDKK